MFTNLTMENFRTHPRVRLEGLSRVNLLSGRNNSGKTAALEAIFFLALPSNPREVLVRLNELRGFGAGTDFEEVWGSLFYNWDYRKDIAIEADEDPKRLETELSFAAGDAKSTCSLRIRPLLGNSAKKRPTGGVIEGSDLAETVRGLLFQYKDGAGRSVEREVTDLTRKPGRRAQADVEAERAVAFLPPRGIPAPQEEAQRYSRLEIAGRHEDVIEALKAVEPRLRRISVVATAHGSVLYGDVGAGHLMPLPLMGDGMLRTLSIALAMVSSRGGLVLIDEAENGLHYSVQTQVWRMIVRTAVSLDVQVFATTHSDECIRSVLEATELEGAREILRGFRFDIVAGGTTVVPYDANELEAAMLSDQEVR